MSHQSPVLTVEDFSCGYESHRGTANGTTIEDIDLELYPGQILGLAGESGSGKSTLARAMAGLLPRARGALKLHGREILNRKRDKETRRRLQLVFQDPATSLSPRRTIAQTLAEPLRLFNIEHGPIRLAEALEEVGLDPSALARFPHQFSSGQRQRIALARALVCDPDVIIADEILSALDVSVQAQVMALLLDLVKRRGLALLLIAHDLAALHELSDEIAVMYQGRIVEKAPKETLFSQAKHPYTQSLLAALPHLDPARPLHTPDHNMTLAQRERDDGCAFRGRCPHRREECETRRPARSLVPGSTGHHVECHLLAKSFD